MLAKALNLAKERRLALCDHVREADSINISGRLRNTMWDKRQDKATLIGVELYATDMETLDYLMKSATQAAPSQR